MSCLWWWFPTLLHHPRPPALSIFLPALSSLQPPSPSLMYIPDTSAVPLLPYPSPDLPDSSGVKSEAWSRQHPYCDSCLQSHYFSPWPRQLTGSWSASWITTALKSAPLDTQVGRSWYPSNFLDKTHLFFDSYRRQINTVPLRRAIFNKSLCSSSQNDILPSQWTSQALSQY